MKAPPNKKHHKWHKKETARQLYNKGRARVRDASESQKKMDTVCIIRETTSMM